MKKDLIYLNSKPWYRFLKVVYILFFLIVLGVTLSTVFNDIGSYQTDYTVTCNYGNKSTFLAAKDKGIYIPANDYSYSLASLPDNLKEKIQSACAISKEELNLKLNNIFNGVMEDKPVKDDKPLFNLKETKINVYTYGLASLWAVLSVVVIFIAFEFFKRAFYYVILGSFFPKKDK